MALIGYINIHFGCLMVRTPQLYLNSFNVVNHPLGCSAYPIFSKVKTQLSLTEHT